MSFYLLVQDLAIGGSIRPASVVPLLIQTREQKRRTHAGFRHHISRRGEATVRRSSTGTSARTHPTYRGRNRKHNSPQCEDIVSSRRPCRREAWPCPGVSSRRFSSRASDDIRQEDGKYVLTQEEARDLVDEASDVGQEEYRGLSANFGSAVWDQDVAVPDPATNAADIQGGISKAHISARELLRALNNHETTHQRLWDIYQTLPEPRALYLPEPTLARLLARLGFVEHKSTPRMLRFLALISDMKKSGLGIPISAWNSAISFAGRCLKKITAREVESALNIWREMEQVAGVDSNNVTFNILFDVATKARKFVLAEMILSEMAVRNMEYNRYFRTSLIYYYGLRANGDGVRKAYSELVDAGEIVDTAVINCIIGALVKCGETASADLVFQRTKQLHASKTDPALPPSHWQARRGLGRRLHSATQRLREINENDGGSDPEAARHVENLRQRTSVAPDLTTYKLLIGQYAVGLGDIDRTAELVDEMAQYEIPVHGHIFRYIYRAFIDHGGVLYTQWTRKRLENTWLAFIEALDAQAYQDEEGSLEDSTANSGTSIHDAIVEGQLLSSDEDADSKELAGQEVFDESQPSLRIKDAVDRATKNYNKSVSAHEQYPPSDKVARITRELLYPEQLDDPGRLVELRDSNRKLEIDQPPSHSTLHQGKNETPDVYIGNAMAKLIGCAFAKCTNLGRTAQVWAEVRIRWVPEVPDDVFAVEAEIASLFPGSEQLFSEMVDREMQRSRGWL